MNVTFPIWPLRNIVAKVLPIFLDILSFLQMIFCIFQTYMAGIYFSLHVKAAKNCWSLQLLRATLKVLNSQREFQYLLFLFDDLKEDLLLKLTLNRMKAQLCQNSQFR